MANIRGVKVTINDDCFVLAWTRTNPSFFSFFFSKVVVEELKESTFGLSGFFLFISPSCASSFRVSCVLCSAVVL